MRGGSRGIAACLTAVLIGVAGVTSCSFDLGPGCTDRDERFADRLNVLAVLELHPPGSMLVDKGADCDVDDGFAWAGRTYRPAPGTDVRAVVAYYRETMPAQGWKLESVNDDPVRPDALVVQASRLCFTRPIEGTDAYFGVWFPSDFGEGTDDFGVDVTASHDGVAYC